MAEAGLSMGSVMSRRDALKAGLTAGLAAAGLAGAREVRAQEKVLEPKEFASFTLPESVSGMPNVEYGTETIKVGNGEYSKWDLGKDFGHLIYGTEPDADGNLAAIPWQASFANGTKDVDVLTNHKPGEVSLRVEKGKSVDSISFAILLSGTDNPNLGGLDRGLVMEDPTKPLNVSFRSVPNGTEIFMFDKDGQPYKNDAGDVITIRPDDTGYADVTADAVEGKDQFLGCGFVRKTGFGTKTKDELMVITFGPHTRQAGKDNSVDMREVKASYVDAVPFEGV